MFATRHSPSGEPNVFIHSLPRSGSTWLMELILTQPGFRRCNEPLNLRKEVVRDHLGISEWADLHRTEYKEKLHRYFAGLCSDSFRDPRFNYRTPLTRFYRPVTRQTVFKVINGGVEHINWLAQAFNGRVLFLLRHPIPVSLSRRYFPELETILDTEFASFFTTKQLALASDILRGDNKLAKGILDWSLRNFVALRARTADWAVVTYEQLVVNPRPAIEHISLKLGLQQPERIIRRLPVPSRSTKQSDRNTQNILLSNPDRNDQNWLVEKWKKEIATEDLCVAEQIVAAFQLDDVYKVANTLPERSYWID